jgi:hypothetical protein
MPLFYIHSKVYHNLFNSILDKIEKIKKKFVDKINEKYFIDILGDYLFHKSELYEYKQIIKILNYGDIIFKERNFDNFVFKPFNMVIDENKNYNNFDYMKNALINENNYFEEKVNYLRDLLDKITDICETSCFLDKQMLNQLDKYLDIYYEEIVANLEKFYISSDLYNHEGNYIYNNNYNNYFNDFNI